MDNEGSWDLRPAGGRGARIALRRSGQVLHVGERQAVHLGRLPKFAHAGAWLGSDPKAVVNPTHGFWVSLAGNAGLVRSSTPSWSSVSARSASPSSSASRPASPAVMGAILMASSSSPTGASRTARSTSSSCTASIMGTIAYVGAGAYALDTAVAKLAITQRIPVIKYALG